MNKGMKLSRGSLIVMLNSDDVFYKHALKIATSYFRDKPQTYLNQNPKGIPLFFPNQSKIIKSYILLKIVYDSDRFIVAMGSKKINKFTKDQQVDLIEYLIQVIQIKLTQMD